MFYSNYILSSKGAIWVAAYCFKRLKKAQVKETDICSSVDKILQDEMNFDSYRVLAYLLLGVVRIYSKKVEYLLHDCNEVLIKIKKFRIDTTKNANMETLRMSITLPDRFELDAFDLGILEEDLGGGNIAPKEEITLKEVLWKDEGIGQFSLDKYQSEEFEFCQNNCSADHLLLEDVQQSQLMDNNYEISPPNSPINLLVSREKFRESLFSQDEPVNFDTIFGVKEVPTEPSNLCSEDQQINEVQTVLETAPYEDEIHEERSMEKIIMSSISQEETMDISMFIRREEELVVSVEKSNVSHQFDEEQIKARETANSECQMHQEIGEVHEARNSPVSMERLQDDEYSTKECMDYDRSSITTEKIEKLMEGSVEKHYNEGKLWLQEEVSIEDGKNGEDQIKVKETANSECQMHQEIGEDHEARNSPISMERLHDDKSNEMECMDHDRSSIDKDKIEELVEGSIDKHHNRGRSSMERLHDDKSNEMESTDHDRSSIDKDKIEELIEGSIDKHHNRGRLKLQAKFSVEDEKFHVISAESKCLDITPQKRSPGNSITKLKPGATTPECMAISTPAVKEHARFSKKRKCVFDRLIVLPNEVLRQSIHDASDLISKRRKFPRSLLATWRASRISRLPVGFYESLLPCHSLELQILFSKKKIKISKSLEIVETLGKLDESESHTFGRLEPNEPAPKTPPQCSKIRSIERQESFTTQISDNLRPSILYECTEREKSLKKGELHLMKECNMGTSSSYASIVEEQCLRTDEELDLMNEETDSLETENSNLCGWSGRTMKVAKYLHRHFLDLRKQREDEVVNFSRVLQGRAKKECARLFYEILVLRTTSCLDVKQNNAYADISIWKLPKLDQNFGVDAL